MKYLTLDWWTNRCSREELEKYWAYTNSIRDRLPSDMLALLDDVSLHDAKLRIWHLDVGDRRLVIRLDGFRYSPKGVGECRRAITLHYDGVREVHSTADPAAGLQGPHGYGDLGYDEVELLPCGFVEHRLLFSTGIELSVLFKEFRLVYEDFPGSP